MGEKIALGFHTCVDYELIWDPEVIRKAIRDFGIRSAELEGEIRPDSERNVWRMVLAYMKAGIGAEILPDQPEIVNAFADRFQYRVTIGGTAARAAIALAKIGYTSVLSMSSYNEWIAKLLPPQIRRFSNTGNAFGPVFPHASFTYLGGQTIEESDICFTTARENRILISRDEESARLAVSEDFAPELADAEVFLLSCFSQILDADVLADRIGKTHRLLSRLSENAVSIMEDGNYVNQSFRTYVHQHLRDVVRVLSMNEDELQEYTGRRIDILDPERVYQAVRETYQKAGFETLIVHSSRWALAYGKHARECRQALTGGVTFAAARFRCGDRCGRTEYEETLTLPDNPEGAAFSERIRAIGGSDLACIPCKDMRSVTHPTVVGLGDTFAGGLLPGFLQAAEAHILTD